MKKKTIVAKQVCGYEESQYDKSCKRLLANKYVLAWIIRESMAEFYSVSIEDIRKKYILGMPVISRIGMLPDETNSLEQMESVGTEDVLRTEGKITYDIRFYLQLPGEDKRFYMIINIESQKTFRPGYPLIKRGIYYGSRLLSAQYGTEFENAHYEKLKKVYSIWICMNTPKKWQNTITEYRIAEKNVLGKPKEKLRNYDLMTIVMIGLGNPEVAQGVLRLLDVVFSSNMSAEEKLKILEKEYDIPVTEDVSREVLKLCNFSEGIYERGVRSGRKAGRKAGRKEGIKAGKKEGRLETIIEIIKNGSEELARQLAKATEEEIKEARKMMV